MYVHILYINIHVADKLRCGNSLFEVFEETKKYTYKKLYHFSRKSCPVLWLFLVLKPYKIMSNTFLVIIISQMKDCMLSRICVE